MYDEYYTLVIDADEVEQVSEDDLWFLPGPMAEEPDYLPPGPRAEAGNATRLARIAG